MRVFLIKIFPVWASMSRAEGASVSGITAPQANLTGQAVQKYCYKTYDNPAATAHSTITSLIKSSFLSICKFNPLTPGTATHKWWLVVGILVVGRWR